MSINLQHLRAFYAVAHDKSMTRAADRLNVSQPTLSKQIKSLEERHQVKLFKSNRPPLNRTPEGEALFEMAKQLFSLVGDIDALLGVTTPDEGGLLRVGTDSPPYAAEFIESYAKRAPALDFKAVIDNARATNEALLAGSVDVAIVCEPTIHTDYTYKPLYDDHLMAIVPARSTLGRSREYSIDRIIHETLILREPTSRTRASIMALLDKELVAPRRIMEVHTREMIREVVARGLGVSFMYAKECTPDPRLKALPIKAKSEQKKVRGYLACRTDRKRHPIISTAFDIIEDK